MAQEIIANKERNELASVLAAHAEIIIDLAQIQAISLEKDDADTLLSEIADWGEESENEIRNLGSADRYAAVKHVQARLERWQVEIDLEFATRERDAWLKAEVELVRLRDTPEQG